MSDFISPERNIGLPTNYERITDDKAFDGFPRERHEFRYKVAAKFVLPNESVVDAACGTGYGRKFLPTENYMGIDKLSNSDTYGQIVLADLNRWVPDVSFDVFISIETIEHLTEYKHLLEQGRKAKRCMIISTPIVPTKATNEFHVNDFTKEGLSAELAVNDWHIVHYEEQDAQYGIWVLWKT